jgi:hypothetical protein
VDGHGDDLARYRSGAIDVIDGATGARIWSAPMGDEGWPFVGGCDLDGDGRAELLVSEPDGDSVRSQVLSGVDGHLLWSLG